MNDEKILKYINEASAATSIDMYRTMTKSVDAAIQVIAVILRENEDARKYQYLKTAQEKLKSASRDLKMLPLEALKNLAVDAISKIKSFIFGE